MAEFESLATHEPLDAHVDRHALDRLMMLCDGVFAIAITLAALEIHAPDAHMAAAGIFGAMARPVAAYVLSFVIIAVFWLRNRDLFARVERVDRPLTLMVLAQLCLIALIPVGVRGVAEFDSEAGFRFYAMTMAGCGLLNLALWAYAGFVARLLHPQVPAGYCLKRVTGAAILMLMFVPLSIVRFDPGLRVSLVELVVLFALRMVVLRRSGRRAISPD